jgi:hypothetical protein
MQSQFSSVTQTKQTISKKGNWVRFWLSRKNETLPQPSSHRVMVQRPMSECSFTTGYRISRQSGSAVRALRQGGCLHADPTLPILPNKRPISSGGRKPGDEAEISAPRKIGTNGSRARLRM